MGNEQDGPEKEPHQEPGQAGSGKTQEDFNLNCKPRRRGMMKSFKEGNDMI